MGNSNGTDTLPVFSAYKEKRQDPLIDELKANPQCYEDVYEHLKQLGRGVDGAVFQLPNGHALKAQLVRIYQPHLANYPGVKDPWLDDSPRFEKEAYVFKKASDLGVAPKVYSYWICGNVGFIEMDNLRAMGYVPGLEVTDAPAGTFGRVVNASVKVAAETGYLFVDTHDDNWFANPNTWDVKVIDWGHLWSGKNAANMVQDWSERPHFMLPPALVEKAKAKLMKPDKIPPAPTKREAYVAEVFAFPSAPSHTPYRFPSAPTSKPVVYTFPSAPGHTPNLFGKI